MDRRQFLSAIPKMAAATSVGWLLEGCGIAQHPSAEPTHVSSSTSSSASSSTSSSASSSVQSATSPSSSTAGLVQWPALRSQLTGSLVLPGESQYPVAKQLYDPVFDSISPQAIAYCQSPTDVQRCIAYARDHGVPLALRSGGHSYAGYSTSTGLVIDVTGMHQVVVSTASGLATVGAGTLQIDVYAQLAAANLVVPGASCPTVGIAGVALGGGIGVLDRKYGLTCDNITSLQIVTADGELRTCDSTHNADLYWACRGGGGGNFGAVTSFQFQTHPTMDLAQFVASWDWSTAADAVPAWLTWAAQAPDELWSNCLLIGGAPGSSPTMSITGVYTGTETALTTLLEQFKQTVGTPPTSLQVWTDGFLPAMLNEAGCGSLTIAQCHLPTQTPQGQLSRATFAAKSDFISEPLDQNGVAALLSGVEERAQTYGLSGGAVILDACGGAVNRIPPSATAFVHRNDLCSVQYFADWGGGGGAVQTANLAWLSAFHALMRPYVSGYAYQNYIDPTLTDWAHAYYGSNLARLIEVKTKYDPDNVFHFAQSIPVQSAASQTVAPSAT